METNQKPINQNPTKTELQLPKESSSSKLFLVVIFSVLLTGVITGSIVYFWQQSSNEKAVSNLEQKITSLEKQISTMSKTTKVTPQPTPTPKTPLSPTTDPITDWKTFSREHYNFIFKYPSDWEEKELGEGCGPVVAPIETQAYWLTVCGPYVNQDDSKEDMAQRTASHGADEQSREDILVGGYEAIKQIINRAESSSEINVFVDIESAEVPTAEGRKKFPNATMAIHFYNRTEDPISTYENLVDQILSTFQFTD